MATATATPAIVIGKDTVVGDISAAVFAKLGAADLAKLSAPQTAEISAEQAATFTPVTLAAVKQASLSGDALAAIPVKSISALVLKNVTPDNFNSLTVEQVAGLSADQVKTISDKTYAAMSDENLAAFAVKGTLNAIDFKKVPADVIPKFLPSQIAGLSDAQLASLVQKSVEALTPEQTAALTATQAKAFTPNFVKFLSPEGVSGLTPAAISAIAPKSLAALAANIEALNDVNTPALTSAQVNALTEVQIKALSTTNNDFQYLSKAALAGLVKKNIVGLDFTDGKVTDEQFVALTADQLNSLTQDDKGQVASLSEAQVELITATQAKGLSEKFIGAMKDSVVSHLSDAAIGALTPKAFSGLTDNIAGLTPANIAAMSSAQINSLNATKIAALSAVENAISSLSNAALAGLDKKNIDGLNVTKLLPEQIAVLTADQLNLFSKTSGASLDAVANQIDSLSGEQVAAITVKQAAGLSPKFVEALAVGDVASLTDVAVAAIAPKAFASMAVEGLVEANLGLVTSAQINALDENDIYKLSDNNGSDAEGTNDLPFLSIAALAGLDKKNIKYVPMNTLTVEQFTSLKADQLNAYATVQVDNNATSDVNESLVYVGATNAAELTATQAKGLLPIFTNKLTAGDISTMSDVAVAALAPKAFASLDVKELVESNLGLVTSAQINALTPAQIKLLGDNNGDSADGANDLQFLTKAALAGLDKKNITDLNLTKLTPEQFAGLTADQLNLVATAGNVARDTGVGATDDQLALLTVAQAKGLTPAFVEELTAEQVGKLTPEAIAALAPKSFVKIDFTGLNADNAGLITSAQINALSAADITSLSYTANTIKYIAPAALAGLDKKNIDGLTKLTKTVGGATVQLLTAEQFAALKPAQIQLLPKEAIAQLTSEDGIAVLTAPIIATFTPDQIAEIPAGSFGKIAPAAIAGLNSKNIVKVTDAQLKALTPDQAAFLTPDALKAFKTTMVDTAVGNSTGDLGSASFAGVTPAALKAMLPNVLAAMHPDTFAGITPEQVAALTTAQTKALTPEQIAKFDAEDAAVLTGAQIGSTVWTAEKATALTSTAIANLTPDAVSKLNISSFNTNTGDSASADIAVLTNEQFQKLTATQVATISAENAALILPAQVDGVKTLGSLKLEAIPKLTNDVVEVLDAAHFGRFTTTNLGQLEKFTSEQFTVVSDEVKASLASKNFSTIITSTKNDSNQDLAGDNLTAAKAAQAIETSLTVDVSESGSGTTIVVGKKEATVIGSDHKDNITGGNGADIIGGGDGNDTIFGGSSADNITGGLGDDELTGEAGADTFDFSTDGSVYGIYTDTIMDYTSGSDIIKFGTATITKAAVDNSDLVASSGSGNVQVNTGGVVTFHADDNDFVEKVGAIQEDVELNAAGQVALFTSGADSYLYYSGTNKNADGTTLANSNTDDQIIKLKDIDATGLIITDSNKITSVSFVPDVTAPVAVATIVSLSADTGTSSSDFITKTAAQTISGTYEGVIASGEALKVSLDDGVNWVAATTATGGNWTLTGQTIASNQIRAAVFDAAGNYSEAALQVVTLDVTAPTNADVDLSADANIQATAAITVNSTEAAAGKSIASAVQAVTGSDIYGINVVLSGAGLDVSGVTKDKLTLVSATGAQALNANFTESGATINSIADVDYAYVASTKTLTLTKNGGGAFTAGNIDNIVSGILFSTASSTQGDRVATISYIDQAGNAGASAATTLTVDTTAPVVSGIVVTDSNTITATLTSDTGTIGVYTTGTTAVTGITPVAISATTTGAVDVVAVAGVTTGTAATVKVIDTAGNISSTTLGVILGSAGNDTLTLTSGKAVFSFGGNDTLTFGSTAPASPYIIADHSATDLLSINTFLGLSDASQPADNTTDEVQAAFLSTVAESAFGTGTSTGSDVTIAGKIVTLSVSDITATSIATDLADDILQVAGVGSTRDLILAADSKAVIVVGETTGTDGVNIYYASTGATGAETITLVGQLVGVSLTNISSADFM